MASLGIFVWVTLFCCMMSDYCQAFVANNKMQLSRGFFLQLSASASSTTAANVNVDAAADMKRTLRQEISERVSPSDGGLPTVYSKDDADKILQYVTQLELLASDIDLDKDFSRLEGNWRLIYTSNRNGAPPRGALVSFDKVFQTISQKDNSVENKVRIALGKGNLKQESKFSLDHSYKILSASRPAQIEITLKKTTVGDAVEMPDVYDNPGGKTATLARFFLPNFSVPASSRFSVYGAGSFEVSYLDDDLRISRGNLGEVRVFERFDIYAPNEHRSSR